MNKRVLFILLPLLIGFSIVGGAYYTAKPYLQTWLLSQINRLNQEKLPVNVTIDEIDWSFLLPKVSLYGVRVSEKKDGLKNIPNLTIGKVSASLDLLAIFAGKIAISSLLLEEPLIEIDMDPFLITEGPVKPLPLNDIFSFLKKAPITRFGIRNAKITLESQKHKQLIKMDSVDILAVNQRERISLQLDLGDGQWKQNSESEIPWHLQGDFVLTPQTLDISSAKLSMLNTKISLSASLKNISKIHIAPEGTVNFEVFAELPQLATVGKRFLNNHQLQGVIKTAGRFELDAKGLHSAGVKFSGQKIRFDKFDIGNVLFDGDFKNDVLTVPKIQITNDAGIVNISKLNINVGHVDRKTQLDLSANLQGSQFDIREFLIRMGLKDLPLEIFISTDMACQGPLYPATEINCKGNVTGEQIEVRTGPSLQETLVIIDKMTADGNVQITDKAVSYTAQLGMGNDKGSSEGTIIFAEGFKIKFATPQFDFSNLGRTAGLKIEGLASLTGSTEGNTDYGTVNIDASVKNGFFEDFKLGDVTTQLRYKSRNVYFENIKGTISDDGQLQTGLTSQYQGNLKIDLDKKRVSATANIPQFEIPHILSVFERRFKMPVEITGHGSADVSVEGPFSLGQLSYHLKAQVSRGMAAGESFDEANIEMKSEAGNMTVQEAIVRKNKSEIKLTGSSQPNGDIDLLIVGDSIPLENSENLSRFGSQISGLLDAQMTLKGFVMNPDVILNGRIRNLNIEEKDFPDSSFKTEISRKSVLGDIDLFSGQLISQFQYPLNESSPFSLKAKARNWNYAALLAFAGAGSLLNDYQASLTGDINLQSAEGGPWASTGKANLSQVILERGNLSLRNKLPIEIEMDSGIGKIKNFHIESSGLDKAFFDIQSDRFSKNDLTMKINGFTNIRLFQLFVPFLEDIGGTVKLDINTAGPITKPEILGTAQVEGGFVKMKVFPHPIERIKSDIQFSQSKVLINQFTANLAGGNLTGDGSILIEGPRLLPVNVKAKFDNVNLNFPNGMRTNGYGDLSFTGNWFPYVFSGTYHVIGGFVDKEFQDDNSAGNSLKQSAYLPKTILTNTNDPILLDLNIILERPLQVKNSMVDGTVTGNIVVRGPPTQFTLGGRLATEKGSNAIFRDKVFQIQTANIQFNNSADMNPDVYVSANSRINQYDISMLIQGSAKSPLVRLSSTPPLSDQDIIYLIALGVTGSALEKKVSDSQKGEASTSAVQGALIGNILTQVSELKKIQQATGVEFQISSTNDDTKNVNFQRFTLSKKLSDRVRAAATQVQGNYQALEYTLQYNLTDNVSAVGRYEDRKPNESSTNIENNVKENQSIFGIDLQFKREFK